MKIKSVYLVLCVIGLVLPYWQFLPWVAANGLHLQLLLSQLFANRVSGFFATDVLVSSLVVIVLLRTESRRLGIRGRWWTVLALLTVGVSLALPLFLYMRERSLERVQAANAAA